MRLEVLIGSLIVCNFKTINNNIKGTCLRETLQRDKIKYPGSFNINEQYLRGRVK